MSTALSTVINTQLTIWESSDNLKQIKEIFAPNLSQLEFTVFVEMGKASNLNPFLKEIWAVKYDKSAPAQIFIGRDGYRKSAQHHPMYDYHYTEAVYSNDTFEVINGDINHKYGMANRGSLLGAYCVVKRKDASKPIHKIVELKEYNTGKSVWSGKPSTMIQKVAEAQTLKSAFQELFGGTYSQYEQFDSDSNRHVDSTNTNRALSKVTELLKKKGQTNDKEPIEISYSSTIDSKNTKNKEEVETGNQYDNDQMLELSQQKAYAINKADENPITDELLDEITGLIKEKPLDSDKMTKAMNYFGKNCIEELTCGQAKTFIKMIDRVTAKTSTTE